MARATGEALPLSGQTPPLTPARAPSRRRHRQRRQRRLAVPFLLSCCALLFQPARAVQVIAASSLEACANDGQVKKKSFSFWTESQKQREREREKRRKKRSRARSQKKLSLSLSLSLSQFDAALNCSQKLVVTLAVESGSSLATTSLDFDVACVLVKSGSSSSGTATPSSPSPSPTATPCPCPCRYGADAGCSCQDLSTPLRVSVTKTPTYATYPLTYIRPFNYGARETVISTGTGWPSLTCDAGSLSSNPTCGWATTGTGLLVSDRVPDSQGFCCDCSLDQLGSGTFGGGSTQGEKRVFGGGGGGGGGGKSGENEKRGREKRR